LLHFKALITKLPSALSRLNSAVSLYSLRVFPGNRLGSIEGIKGGPVLFELANAEKIIGKEVRGLPTASSL
jgi:hypothetical protein